MLKSPAFRLVLLFSAVLAGAVQAQTVAPPSNEVIPTPVVTDPNGQVIPHDKKRADEMPGPVRKTENFVRKTTDKTTKGVRKTVDRSTNWAKRTATKASNGTRKVVNKTAGKTKKVANKTVNKTASKTKKFGRKVSKPFQSDSAN